MADHCVAGPCLLNGFQRHTFLCLYNWRNSPTFVQHLKLHYSAPIKDPDRTVMFHCFIAGHIESNDVSDLIHVKPTITSAVLLTNLRTSSLAGLVAMATVDQQEDRECVAL